MIVSVVFVLANCEIGLAVPIPTRLFAESTFRVEVSTVRSPVMVALARVAVPPAPRIWLEVIFFVVPDAAIDVSETSTIGRTSAAGSTVVMAAKAVIFVSAIC